jgi:cellulose biosynthesis protein BcsQ
VSKVISLFNHKGGVSKTTTTFHLGWMLANLGKKVLIVDADPQCNLTGLVLGINDYDQLFDFYNNRRNNDIYTSLAGIFGYSNVKIDLESGVESTKTKNDNLNLLAGHIDFAKFDLQIATALTSSASIPVLKPLLGSINKLIRRTGEYKGFDVILIDMSPSISATNMCIFMASDYFIIPTSPDFFCYQAIDSLCSVIPDWLEKVSPFKDDTVLRKHNPQMLGIISQNYRVYGSDKDNMQQDMTAAFREWSDKIKNITNDKLVVSLRKYGMVVDEKDFCNAVDYDKPYNLANIQSFNSLIPISQKLSKPIFELTKKTALVGLGQYGKGNMVIKKWERK